jgi:hypothetical protein
LRSSDSHFQAFELHVRKPSYVVGLEGRYTRNIFADLGLPNDEYKRVLAAHQISGMNLGAWVGPKEESSAEPLSGAETNEFQSELTARGHLTTALMRRTAELNGKSTWGFKILGDIAYADKYAKVWPSARFILQIRDPRDTAVSILRLNEYRAVRRHRNFFDDVRGAASAWKHTITTARGQLHTCDNQLLEIRYEDLVRDPAPQLRRLSEFVNCDLSHGLEYFGAEFVRRHVRRHRHLANLQKPLDSSSIGQWQAALTPEEAAAIEETAGGLMSEFDYR